MLTLLNTLGKTVETFRPVDEKVINIFTCGPSVYQRSHIGNFRTFLWKHARIPRAVHGDEWHPFSSPPLVGGVRGGGKWVRIFTPTFVLPHQGGGDCF